MAKSNIKRALFINLVKSYKIIILLLSFILNINLLSAQDNFSRDTLISDFNQFISVLEQTHPDPYYPFGGKMPFHKEAKKTIGLIPNSGLSKNDFKNILSQFVSRLHDGHTFILEDKEQNDLTDKVLNLQFKIVTDGLVVSQSPQKALNGLKVVSINGINIEELLEKTQLIKPCENLSGQYLSLIRLLNSKRSAERLLKNIEDNAVQISFIDNNNQLLSSKIAYVDLSDKNVEANLTLNLSNIFHKNLPFSYRYMDNENKIVCFNYSSTYSREVIELQKKWGQNYTSTLKMLYQTYQLGDIPDEYSEAIAKLPSMNVTFFEMLTSMKQNNSTHLIVDLRNNGGGWNPINLPTLYMLMGDSYFEKKYNPEYNTLISELLLQGLNSNIDSYNKNNQTNYSIGDYNFGYFSANDKSKHLTLEKKCNEFLEGNYGNSISGIQLLKNMNGQAIYTPKVIVVTSPKTFSAAFQYAYLLKEICDATIVGVSSSQAPNNGMGATFYKLNNTEIKGSVSNSYQLFDPENKLRDAMLAPDYPLTWNIFSQYNCHKDSELLYIIDLIEKEKLD